ncbi:MAG: nitrate reductase molybdenum cofactor assembly chaperone [Microbacteriaceae bacterium]|nr:nitrate reductase molybdenum cofactor assembly chaperone [Microbacteriaceae bacterium]MCL2794481.1 nitrate reductase molybdenum cofactor assembly chaperone [Microbacteriaceae bacterium]
MVAVLTRLLERLPRGGAGADAAARVPAQLRPVAWTAAAILLGYPDERQRERLGLVRAALAEAGLHSAAGGLSRPAGGLGHSRPGGSDGSDILDLVDELAARDLAALQAEYVQEFDLSRRHSLHLSYWTDGDTRRRGEAIGRFKEAYRAHGAEFDETELPDYLPMVLEFAARISPEDGAELLQAYRASLELLRLALERDHLVWAPAVALVCATLPGASPATEAEAMALAGATGPQTETVGLDPYPTGLLPLRSIDHGEK